MIRIIILGITLLLGTSLYNFGSHGTTTPLKQEAPQEQNQSTTQVKTGTSLPQNENPQGQNQSENKDVKNEAEIVNKLVKDFGKRLQMVALTASPKIASQSIRDNYGKYISAALLTKWLNNPGQALGRMVSSPWPDRIEVLSTEKTSASVYKINGEIIEITSVEKANGGFAAKRSVNLVVKKIDDRWLIDEATVGSEVTPNKAVVYQNNQYGFNFSLPDSWKGYTIVTSKWEGLPIGDGQVVETGPQISIRDPRWTNQKPRQDIPIMIFTLNQWNGLQQEKFHIGAAPIGPSELGRNHQYVFALPARYNFAFLPGYEEVETILNSKPLQPFELTNTMNAN